MEEENINDTENTASEDENKSTISSDLIRGHINTIILRTLYERDKYGYEIIEEIEAKSHGQYTLKQPTLYSALKRLESQGYVNAYWKTDEVSQGGRRKYYTLTDNGREIAEKNQSEWEYSRTVIDSLISDKSFDFTQPAPTSVDFKILKNSTTRVPSNKVDDDEQASEGSSIISQQQTVQSATQTETVPQPVSQPIAQVEPVQQPQQTEAAPLVQPQPVQSDEERKKLHENYLKLISEPAETAKPTEVAPHSDGIDTEKLIYNNRPETERDYRNLINNLFVKTVKPQTDGTEAEPANVAPAVQPERNTRNVTPVVRYEDVNVSSENDGLTVNTSTYENSGSRRKKYDLGAILFKSSLIVAVIMLFEFALCLIFRTNLNVSLAYPFVIFAIGCAQLLIFGVLRLMNVGKNSGKPATLTYLTASIIVSIIAILIIFVAAILLNVNFTSVADIFAKIIIPAIVALNIPIFATTVYFFGK